MRTTIRLTRTLAVAAVAAGGLLSAGPAQASIAPPEPSRDCSVITRLSQADATHVRVSTTIACDHTYTLNIALQVKRSGGLVYSHGRVCSAPSRSCTGAEAI